MLMNLTLVQTSCLMSSLVGRQLKSSVAYWAMCLLSRARSTGRLFFLSRQRAHSVLPCPGSFQDCRESANICWMNKQVEQTPPHYNLLKRKRCNYLVQFKKCLLAIKEAHSLGGERKLTSKCGLWEHL